jgi:hypothetical protein
MTPITASTSATVSPNDNVESQSRNCDKGSIVFSLLKLWERQVCNPALPTAWIETAEIWRLVIRGPRKNFVNVFANVVASAPPRCVVGHLFKVTSLMLKHRRLLPAGPILSYQEPNL